MSKHSPQDRRLLQELIRQERLTREEAQEVLESLDLHQVRNARVRLPDILVKKEIVTVSELAQLTARIDEIEDEDAVARGQRVQAAPAMTSRSAGGSDGGGSGGGAGIRLALISLSVVSSLVLVAVIIWKLKRPEPQPEPVEPVVVVTEPDTEPEPIGPAPVVRAEPKRVDPLERELRGELERCLIESDVKKRIMALDDLYTRSASHLPVDSAIRAAQKSTREELNRLAQSAYDEARPRWQALLDVEEFAKAVAIIDDLLEQYGIDALEGEIQHQRSLVQQDLERYCERLVRAGKRAFRHDNVADAKASFTKVLAIGSRSQIAVAETWLRQIAAKDTVASGGGEEETTIAKGDEDGSSGERDGGSGDSGRDDSGRDDSGGDDSGSGDSGSGDDEEVAAEEPVEVDPRIVAIRARLKDLLPSGRATLADDGTLVVTYDLETKDPRNGDDWIPEIEGHSLGESVRWSNPREEDGVRVSDAGYWRNRARLRAPIKFDVTFHNMTSFSPRNVMALAWVSDRGSGVATNMGQQTGYVKAGKVGSLKGRLFPYGARMNYKLSLEVGEHEFFSTHNRTKARPRPRKKGQENGVCSLLWTPQVMGVLTEIRIEGKLDLDWAEGALE